MSNFRTIDRETGFLLPPSVDEWLPEKHLARFVVEVVEGLDLRAMSGSYRGSGSASYHPRMLLGLLVYGYATGVFSSRSPNDQINLTDEGSRWILRRFRRRLEALVWDGTGMGLVTKWLEEGGLCHEHLRGSADGAAASRLSKSSGACAGRADLASPKWNFDDATLDRTAASFENPDHVAIVIHNYRWRQGLAEGEPKYDDLEKRLAQSPVITVPTITLEGDANGAAHPDPASYTKMFSGEYSHRTITGGVGHNLPQEAPQAFAEAIVEVAAV